MYPVFVRMQKQWDIKMDGEDRTTLKELRQLLKGYDNKATLIFKTDSGYLYEIEEVLNFDGTDIFLTGPYTGEGY